MDSANEAAPAPKALVVTAAAVSATSPPAAPARPAPVEAKAEPSPAIVPAPAAVPAPAVKMPVRPAPVRPMELPIKPVPAATVPMPVRAVAAPAAAVPTALNVPMTADPIAATVAVITHMSNFLPFVIWIQDVKFTESAAAPARTDGIHRKITAEPFKPLDRLFVIEINPVAELADIRKRAED